MNSSPGLEVLVVTKLQALAELLVELLVDTKLQVLAELLVELLVDTNGKRSQA